MVKVLLNMPQHYIDNPPKMANCKYCGAEPELGGEPWWEWWQHYVCCSNHCLKSHKIESGCSSIESIVEKWNMENSDVAED